MQLPHQVEVKVLILGILLIAGATTLALYQRSLYPSHSLIQTQSDQATGNAIYEDQVATTTMTPMAEKFDQGEDYASVSIQLFTKDKYSNPSIELDPWYEEILKAVYKDGTTIPFYDLKSSSLPATIATDGGWSLSPLGDYFYFTVVNYEGTVDHLIQITTGKDVYKEAGINYGIPSWPQDESFLVVEVPGVPIDGTTPALLVSRKGTLANLKTVYQESEYNWNTAGLTTIGDISISGNLVRFSVGTSTPVHYTYDVVKETLSHD